MFRSALPLADVNKLFHRRANGSRRIFQLDQVSAVDGALRFERRANDRQLQNTCCRQRWCRRSCTCARKAADRDVPRSSLPRRIALAHRFLDSTQRYRRTSSGIYWRGRSREAWMRDSLAQSERTKSQNPVRARGKRKKEGDGHSCRSPSRKQTKSALFLARLQIFEQMMNEVVDIALREREGIAAHRLFADGAIGQMLG